MNPQTQEPYQPLFNLRALRVNRNYVKVQQEDFSITIFLLILGLWKPSVEMSIRHKTNKTNKQTDAQVLRVHSLNYNSKDMSFDFPLKPCEIFEVIRSVASHTHCTCIELTDTSTLKFLYYHREKPIFWNVQYHLILFATGMANGSWYNYHGFNPTDAEPSFVERKTAMQNLDAVYRELGFKGGMYEISETWNIHKTTYKKAYFNKDRHLMNVTVRILEQMCCEIRNAVENAYTSMYKSFNGKPSGCKHMVAPVEKQNPGIEVICNNEGLDTVRCYGGTTFSIMLPRNDMNTNQFVRWKLGLESFFAVTCICFKGSDGIKACLLTVPNKAIDPNVESDFAFHLLVHDGTKQQICATMFFSMTVPHVMYTRRHEASFKRVTRKRTRDALKNAFVDPMLQALAQVLECQIVELPKEFN